MTTITKILCAIDLTKASRNAFDRALSIARVSKARLYVLHAVPTDQTFSSHQGERLNFSRACASAQSARGSRSGSSSNRATLPMSSCSMRTPGKPISSSWDPTGDADGSGFERARLVNVCSAGRPGAC